MKPFLPLLLVFALMTPAFAKNMAANDTKTASVIPSGHAPTPAEGTLAQFQLRYSQTEEAYDRELRTLTDTPEGRAKEKELRTAFRTVQAEQLMAAVRLAEANPSLQTGFDALEWVLKDRSSYYIPAGPAALSLMIKQYAAKPAIGSMLATLGYYFPDPDDISHKDALQLLHAVVKNNPDRTARGHAALGLAWLAKREFQAVEFRGDLAEITSAASQTEKIFEAIVRDYGDCPNLRTVGVAAAKATIGGEAEAELRELRNLSISRAAPQIDGEDLDGVRFKLSDYRGKVVLLVFWASWCGPCMASVPHEKELVERFKGRPFILIGVNGDTSQQAATKAVNKNLIPWRSFWNGKEGTGTTIAADWNVRSWPTVYVLDHKGTIRQKYLHGKRLDDFLEKLVIAAEQDKR